MGLVQKSFSDIITFSRSSNATRVGPTGLVQYAPHNLLQRSQEFDNAYWSKTASSVTANTTSAPDGTVTADSLIENSADAQHYLSRNLGTLVGTHTISFYAKANGRNWIAINLVTAADNRTFFNLSTGVVGTNASGNAATITNVGNGWYRCSVSRTLDSATWVAELYLASSDGTLSYPGNGTSGIYLWGAQLSVGPYALDYTPTTSAAVYGPRFDYDPVTLAARGLLVEEQRTNLVTWSEDFSNGSWIKGLATISANSGTAPDGTQTADKLIPTAVSSSDHGVYQITAASGVGVYTVSAFMKAAGYNFADIFDGYGSALITVDLTNGSYSVVGSPTATSVTAFGNGWYRVTITRTVSGVPAYIQIRAQNDINRTAFTGDGTSGIYVWGAQSEQASFATSYIPTIGTVTRSADVASVNTLSPWWNATESTIYSEFDTFSTNDAFPYALGTKNNNEVDVYRVGSNGNVATLMFTSTVLQNNSTIATGTALNATIKAAYAIKANDLAGSANGGAAVTDTTATLPSVSTLYLGARDDGTGPLNGHLRRLAVYPRRLTNAEIQALTS